MGGNFTIIAGTAGLALWRSPDGGDTWRMRGPFGKEVPYEAQVRGVAIDPRNSNIMYAGDEFGVYKSENRGDYWKHLEGFPELSVWSIEVDPEDSNVIFAGTRPAHLFRSQDGGKTWSKLDPEMPVWCPAAGPTRVTGIRIDPTDHRRVWVGVEKAGLYRSLDGGDSWVRIHGGLSEEPPHTDVHYLNLAPGTEIRHENGRTHLVPGNKVTTLLTLQDYVYATDDLGESMHVLASKDELPLKYLRGFGVKADEPTVLFLGTTDNFPGKEGNFLRSRNGGASWESVKLPGETNSGIWHVATNPAQPNLILAATLLGEIYRSQDGGETWDKIKQELSEIRGLAWAPN